MTLFASQFRSTSLAEKVAKTLQRHGVAADRIELELTENIAVRNTRAVVETLTALRALGVGIALDDFGTGFASLSVLRDFPITRLKVDRSFVADIAVGSDQSAVVDSILTLGRAFGVEVIAEGIETIVQARWLRAKGCHEGQGWHYGYPVLPTEIEAIVSAAKGHAARWSA
ncbi:EAL domain-containing protein [Sphingomonas sanguinis]|uniref:EAL domain-containing protein n=2 Tax=Sphingomonas sanguinis TaxID=33051 RepID=A0A7Y7QZ45_9SPHN|nr:EAL domain-containing protein [Sphingomonas sanguinis]MBZ6384122.1 EAL domain-containing protein [Sphingomonas sanguinis]NNG48151.1 EAL domain-containing protein [Sphingomonas sanguinis]NVP33414.1 EAL domain-containing protein [Sphingomonas sanguinis]